MRKFPFLFRTIPVFLLAMLLLCTPGPASAAPAADGGGFPTATPTQTPAPTQTPTPTNTQQSSIVLTLEIPTATGTLPSFNPEQPSSVLAETPEAEEPARNPLVSLAYVVLFIFLVVGVWMLFTRRGSNP